MFKNYPAFVCDNFGGKEANMKRVQGDFVKCVQTVS